MRRAIVITSVFLAVFCTSGPGYAHEPIFGLGPHTIFKDGLGLEMEIEGEKASGKGEVEKDFTIHTELIYGLTTDLSATLAVPYIIDRTSEAAGVKQSSSGPGDVSLRAKYRFWRKDGPGVQDAAAAVVGVKLPTADEGKTPGLGSGSTDFLLGLTAARESLLWYWFGDLRYRINTKGSSGRKAGDRFFADLAAGIRPWPPEYLRPDLVVLVELNCEYLKKTELNGTDIADSGGKRMFFSPAFFLTYRNWAVKAGVQLPVYQDMNGEQTGTDYRFKLAVELHL